MRRMRSCDSHKFATTERPKVFTHCDSTVQKPKVRLPTKRDSSNQHERATAYHASDSFATKLSEKLAPKGKTHGCLKSPNRALEQRGFSPRFHGVLLFQMHSTPLSFCASHWPV